MQSFKDCMNLVRRNGIFTHIFLLVWQHPRTRYRQKLSGILKLHYQWKFPKIFFLNFSLDLCYRAQEYCLDLSGPPCTFMKTGLSRVGSNFRWIEVNLRCTDVTSESITWTKHGLWLVASLPGYFLGQTNLVCARSLEF